MRIGLVTTWNSICGVAEYSRALAGALRHRGHAVAILASYPVNQVPGTGDDEHVFRWFFSGWHAERGVDRDGARAFLRRYGAEVLHVQYQNFIYPAEVLPALRELAAEWPLVATFHDAGVPGDFPRQAVARAIVHTPVTAALIGWPDAVLVPIGVHHLPTPPPEVARAALGIESRHVLGTVGLGRTDYGAVLAAMTQLRGAYPDLLWLCLGPEGYALAVRHAAHDAGLAGHVRAEGGFFPLEVLFSRLHAADVGVFYFGDSPVEGVASSSVRLGIAARRPLVTSDVGWTRDLPAEMKVPPGRPDLLAQRIAELFDDPGRHAGVMAAQERLVLHDSWDNTAGRHERVYAEALARGPQG